MSWKEVSAMIVVIAMLAGLPLLLWHWRAAVVADVPAPHGRLITLTAVADGGIWTQEEVAGFNYWWKHPVRAEEILLNQGDHVVLRLRSADLLHSFAIPLLKLGPVDVPAGHTVKLEFDAVRPGVLTFLCWQVCSPDHPKLHGRFVVKASGNGEGGEADEWQAQD